MLAGVGACLEAGAALAADKEPYKDFVKAGQFDIVRDELKDAIINRGYVIDFIGRFGDMLHRTAGVGGPGEESPYISAEYFLFCPVKFAHEGVAASPFYIANCPIALYVFELRAEAGKIHVGYRVPTPSPVKALQAVNAKLELVLEEIAKETIK